MLSKAEVEFAGAGTLERGQGCEWQSTLMTLELLDAIVSAGTESKLGLLCMWIVSLTSSLYRLRYPPALY